jgi:hypothetical protein
MADNADQPSYQAAVAVNVQVVAAKQAGGKARAAIDALPAAS